MVKASALVMGVLIIGFIITGFYTSLNDMASDQGGYAVTVDDQYTAEFDKTINTSEKIQQGWSNVSSLSANQDSALQYIKLVPETAILIKNIIVLPFSMVSGMVSSIVMFLHLPEWVSTLLLTFITILFMFAIVSIVLRYRHT